MADYDLQGERTLGDARDRASVALRCVQRMGPRGSLLRVRELRPLDRERRVREMRTAEQRTDTALSRLS